MIQSKGPERFASRHWVYTASPDLNRGPTETTASTTDTQCMVYSYLHLMNFYGRCR